MNTLLTIKERLFRFRYQWTAETCLEELDLLFSAMCLPKDLVSELLCSVALHLLVLCFGL